MFDIFLNYATDENLETQGVWREISPGCELLIARHNNLNFQRKLSELYTQHDQILELGGDLAEKKAKEITIEATASTVLLGFKNVGYKGKPMDYSVENAITLLQHKDFRELVNLLSRQRDQYICKMEETQGEA